MKKAADSVKETLCGTLVFISAFSAYLSLLSKSYVFEGLARAMPIEVGRFRNLFNGNYLLYGLAGWGFHHLILLCGGRLLAVTSLQIMDALVGAAGLWLFFGMLRRIGADLASALLWSVILGATLGYARWSTDAEDYIFSTFLLLVNFYALIVYREQGSREAPQRLTSLNSKSGKISSIRLRPAALGALHALAVMGHIVNVAFAPVVLWFIAETQPKKWKKAALEYAVVALSSVVAAYSTALLIVRPGSPGQALGWFWGSAARSRELGGVTFGGGVSLEKIGLWLRMTGNILTSYCPSFEHPAAPAWSAWALWIARAALILFAVVLGARWREISRRRRTVLVGGCIWLGCYALVFTSWQPDTMVYRTTDLPAICLLLFLASKELGWTGLTISFVLAASLGLGNFTAEIYPRSFETNNPDLSRMVFIRDHTGPDDWIAGGGGRYELYIPYFAQRKPLLLELFRNRLPDLDSLIDRLRGEHAVWITSQVLKDPQWRSHFHKLGPHPAADDGNGFALYRL